MKREVHIELLLGRRVYDVHGQVAGRILAIRAKTEGAHCFVIEYHLGAEALLRRLGITSGRLIGIARPKPRVVPWNQLDLSDPERPRLTVGREQLREAVEPPREEGPPRPEPPRE
jgi:hypothetical protein